MVRSVAFVNPTVTVAKLYCLRFLGSVFLLPSEISLDCWAIKRLFQSVDFERKQRYPYWFWNYQFHDVLNKNNPILNTISHRWARILNWELRRLSARTFHRRGSPILSHFFTSKSSKLASNLERLQSPSLPRVYLYSSLFATRNGQLLTMRAMTMFSGYG